MAKLYTINGVTKTGREFIEQDGYKNHSDVIVAHCKEAGLCIDCKKEPPFGGNLRCDGCGEVLRARAKEANSIKHRMARGDLSLLSIENAEKLVLSCRVALENAEKRLRAAKAYNDIMNGE